jgi:hypothetical protein
MSFNQKPARTLKLYCAYQRQPITSFPCAISAYQQTACHMCLGAFVHDWTCVAEIVYSVSEMKYRTIRTCQTTLQHATGDTPPPCTRCCVGIFIGILDASNVYNFSWISGFNYSYQATFRLVYSPPIMPRIIYLFINYMICAMYQCIQVSALSVQVMFIIFHPCPMCGWAIWSVW